MSPFHQERVLSVHHWTDRLFSFRTTRTPSFRFRSGQFVMMGLRRRRAAAAARLFAGERPLRRRARVLLHQGPRRAADLAPPAPEGGRRDADRPQADRHAGRSTTSSPAGRSSCSAPAPGLAPFLSIVRDPEAYDKFERIVVAHGVRWIKDLAYGDCLADELPNDELIGELVREKLIYYPTVTREPFRNQGRISLALTTATLTRDSRPAADRPGARPFHALRQSRHARRHPHHPRRARLRGRQSRRARRLRDREGVRGQVSGRESSSQARRAPSTALRAVPLPRSAGEDRARKPPYPPLRLQSCLDRRQGGRLFGDMVDTFFIPGMRFAVVVAPVDPVGDAQRRPQVHRFRDRSG